MLAVAHFKQKSLCPVAFAASVILRDYFYCSSSAQLDKAKMCVKESRVPKNLLAKKIHVIRMGFREVGVSSH